MSAEPDKATLKDPRLIAGWGKGKRVGIPFISKLSHSPFGDLMEHADKVKECAWKFQQAIECHFSQECESFAVLRREVTDLEHEADVIKQRIRENLPRGSALKMEKFQLLKYLSEQDRVLDAVEDTLDWLSHRSESAVPDPVAKDFFLLVDAVIAPIEELFVMLKAARDYFAKTSEKQRKAVKEAIQNLRRQEHEADTAENMVKGKIFKLDTDPVTIFHLIRLAELIGAVADRAEDAGDVMRAMMAR